MSLNCLLRGMPLTQPIFACCMKMNLHANIQLFAFQIIGYNLFCLVRKTYESFLITLRLLGSTLMLSIQMEIITSSLMSQQQ